MKTFTSISFIMLAVCSLNIKAQTTTTNSTTTTSSDKENINYSKQAKSKFVWGAKAGLNRSNVYDESGMDFVADPKSGFAGGVFAAIPLGSFVGIQPEILFSQKGFSGTGTIDGQRYDITRTTNYLDVPLQLQLKPFRFLSIVGGVQYSYLLKQSDAFTFGTNSTQQSQEFKNDNIRKNIFGGVGGFDVNLEHYVLSGRMGWDMTTNNGNGSSYTPRYKNVWLQATIGYRFY